MHWLAIESAPKRAEVVVWTDDVDHAFARLVTAGAGVLSPPHNFIGRLRAAWVSDPDGGNVQLVAELPASERTGYPAAPAP